MSMTLAEFNAAVAERKRRLLARAAAANWPIVEADGFVARHEMDWRWLVGGAALHRVAQFEVALTRMEEAIGYERIVEEAQRQHDDRYFDALDRLRAQEWRRG
jgi:hypothetical protein